MRYKCLVLDHDDTVVASEATVNYPCMLEVLDRFRPGEYITPEEFTRWCFGRDFPDFLREKYRFTDQELKEEHQLWRDYAATRIPPAYPGIRELILEQKNKGGLVCVVSHSSKFNIHRDYRSHFGIEPDLIFSCDDPPAQRKPFPYPLEKIMESYALAPKDLLMVDDLKAGYDMAKAVGVDFAFAGWGRQNVPEILEFMKEYCDFPFETVEELYQFQFGGKL